MDGFKNTTKTQYMKGGSCAGYAKGGSVKGAAKISKVMGEFKSGKLHSGSKDGPKVTNPKQATAIAMSEARGAKMPIKRDRGGEATIADLNRANRDFGGMSEAAIAAAGRAIESGNRMSAEEGNESRLVTRKAGAKAGAKVPVQKKSLGGVLEAISPLAAIASGKPENLLTAFGGLNGLLIQQLLKKKQSGAITPDEQKKLDAAGAGSSSPAAPAPAAAKKGGLMKKAKGYADGGDTKIIPTNYTLQKQQKAQDTSGGGGGDSSSRAAPTGGASGGLGDLGGGYRIGSMPGGGTGLTYSRGNTQFGVGMRGGNPGVSFGAKLKEGGKVAKKGVPVAPKGPLVGLSVMPRGKK